MSERKSPRAVLALIALADLPTPNEVRFYRGEVLAISLDTVADGLAWCEHIGAEHADTYFNTETGRRHLREGVVHWYGWRVQLLAYDPPGEALDPETVSALETVAEDGEQR